MFRQRLRLPHHLTFGVLPRISGRPQGPSCSRSRTRFPGDRRTLLPLGSALTSLLLASRCFLFFSFSVFFLFAPPLPPLVSTRGSCFWETSIIQGASLRGGPSRRRVLILPLTIKFFAVSFPLRRSPVLLFTKALEPFAGLRSQFDRPGLFIVRVTVKAPAIWHSLIIAGWWLEVKRERTLITSNHIIILRIRGRIALQRVYHVQLVHK